MPFINVTDIVLNEEAEELQELLKDQKNKRAFEQFESERKLRRELASSLKETRHIIYRKNA